MSTLDLGPEELHLIEHAARSGGALPTDYSRSDYAPAMSVLLMCGVFDIDRTGVTPQHRLTAFGVRLATTQGWVVAA